MNPEDLKYTAEHEWVKEARDEAVRVGITDFAQDALGDIVYINLPEVGQDVEAGAAMGELESTKSVSDLFAPVSGTVSARNEALDANPELCNTDPYGTGWIVEITPSEPSQLDGLLTAHEYDTTITSS